MTWGKVLSGVGLKNGRQTFIFIVAVLGALIFSGANVSSQQIGVGELERLIADHLPRNALPESTPLDVLDLDVDLGASVGTVNFSIPGFNAYGCASCHQGQNLLEKAARRMQTVLARLRKQFPKITTIPLKQYIIQPFANELLKPDQFAHTTFDSIRIFPRTILVDAKVYDGATHLHETLHLTQQFVGPPNELEAYGLNVRLDPRFLLLNYPYFEDVVTAFFLPEFPKILHEFFARSVRENLHVPREVQWLMNAFDPDAIQSVANAVKKMEPLLNEVTELLGAQPVRASYWSEQTGNRAFLLEIAAVKLLPLPALDVSREIRLQAFAIIDKQMKKTDNVRLGYVIDRKKESLLTLKYQLKLKEPLTRLSLYFHYLKGRFIGPDGKIRLGVQDKEDLINFTEKKLEGISKMAQSGGLTDVEKEGARRLVKTIEQKLQEF